MVSRTTYKTGMKILYVMYTYGMYEYHTAALCCVKKKSINILYSRGIIYYGNGTVTYGRICSRPKLSKHTNPDATKETLRTPFRSLIYL